MTKKRERVREERKKYLKNFYWRDYVNITIGLSMYSLGVIGFIKPVNIVMGALTGVSLLLDYATEGGIPMQETILVVNLVLLAIGLKILGGKFLIKTIFGVFVLTGTLTLFGMFLDGPIISGEPLLSGVIGAMLCGSGLGMVYSAGGSSGGTDIIIATINKYRDVSFGRGMMFVDFLIISSSYFVFQDINVIIYGLIVMFVMTYMIDVVINGTRQSVQIFIISKQNDMIADAINREMKRGCTMLNGMGWFSKEDTKVIMTLSKRSEAIEIVRIAKGVDENAFITQTPVKSVYGHGFDSLRKR